jgi:hypothetical protein
MAVTYRLFSRIESAPAVRPWHPSDQHERVEGRQEMRESWQPWDEHAISSRHEALGGDELEQNKSLVLAVAEFLRRQDEQPRSGRTSDGKAMLRRSIWERRSLHSSLS